MGTGRQPWGEALQERFDSRQGYDAGDRTSEGQCRCRGAGGQLRALHRRRGVNHWGHSGQRDDDSQDSADRGTPRMLGLRGDSCMLSQWASPLLVVASSSGQGLGCPRTALPG